MTVLGLVSIPWPPWSVFYRLEGFALYTGRGAQLFILNIDSTFC